MIIVFHTKKRKRQSGDNTLLEESVEQISTTILNPPHQVRSLSSSPLLDRTTNVADQFDLFFEDSGFEEKHTPQTSLNRLNGNSANGQACSEEEEEENLSTTTSTQNYNCDTTPSNGVVHFDSEHSSSTPKVKRRRKSFEIELDPSACLVDTSKRRCKKSNSIPSSPSSLRLRPRQAKETAKEKQAAIRNALVPTSEETKESWEVYLEKAKRAIESSEQRKAISYLEKIIETPALASTIKINVWKAIGRLIVDRLIPDQGKKAEKLADHCFQNYLKKTIEQPWTQEKVEAYTDFGMIYHYTLNDIKTARRYFKVLVNGKQGGAQPLFELGKIYDEELKYDLAYELFMKVSQMESPYQVLADNNLGCYWEKKISRQCQREPSKIDHIIQASQYFLKAAKATTSSGEAYYNLGRLYDEYLDRFPDGKKLARDCFEIGANQYDDGSCWYNLGISLQSQSEDKSSEEIIDCFKRSLNAELSPEKRLAAYQLGKIYFNLKDKERSKEYYTIAEENGNEKATKRISEL